ncbi:hypothetical protein L3081_21355 [Colwellia sp. MSW7]|uniref:Uncharacterized protein n=1 Tax=Colwellia maritima TaxID=2912588 RepID=A0ABS9X5F5_9GAMM|nr:hypothetical protein [Colwellia maritima]MCI2285475.1 hypothetical protein [Colwellia maritima]
MNLYSLAILVAISAFIACGFLGLDYILKIGRGITAGFSGFFEGFKQQGRYALVGVLTTDATANSHVYLVTFMLGPEAYAPLAAARLLFRPISVVFQSITQVERPKVRKLILEGKIKVAQSHLKKGRDVTLVAWGINTLVCVCVLSFFLDYYWRSDTGHHALIIATILIGLINLIKSIRNPLSLYLQAVDKFKPLSLITIKSAIVTIPTVFFCLQLWGGAYSLIGVLVGELITFLLLKKLFTREINE